MINISIRGKRYSSDQHGELQLLAIAPLYEGAPEDIPEHGTPEYEAWVKTVEGKAWNQTVLSRFGDPVMQAKIAYMVSSHFPDIPEDVASYRLIQRGNDYEVKFRLNMSLTELLDYVSQVAPLVEGNKDADTNADEIAELREQIRTLQAARPKAEGFSG